MFPTQKTTEEKPRQLRLFKAPSILETFARCLVGDAGVLQKPVS